MEPSMKRLDTQGWSDFPTLSLVRSSRSIRRAGKITLLVLFLGALSLLFVPWRQSAMGSGTVLAQNPQERPQAFKSPTKGIVRSVKADLREGSYVAQGEILIELEPTAEGGVQQLELQIAAVKNKQELARGKMEFATQQIQLQEDSGLRLRESLAEELKAAKTKWQQSQNELAAAESDLVDKSNKRRIAEEVYAKGIISREELVTKTQDEATQQQKVAKAARAVEEELANFEGKRQQIESKLNDIEIKNREAQNKKLTEEKELQNALKEFSDLEVKRQELQRLTITAPRSGFIQDWFGVENSDTVKEGDLLFVIVPETEQLSVEMLISGNDVPLVQVGDKVRLQFEGWPAVQFTRGWPSASIGTFGGQVNRIFPTDDGKGNFRLLVTPAMHLEQDHPWPANLRQGGRVTAWVLLREVSLGYELWRQINGFPPARNDYEPEEDKSSKPKIKPPKI
jgi:multidrug resistance efflux pump